MSRILALLILLPILGQATHLEQVVAICSEACDESEGENCAPGCDACLCCRHSRLIALPAASLAPEPEPSEHRFLSVALPPAESRPADIFHVPRTTSRL